MFFRKRKPSLQTIIDRMVEASTLAYRYKWDRSYIPNAEELALFDELEKRWWSNFNTIVYLNACMHQRARGEPEGSPKWHDKDVFDYHYPP